MKLYLQLASYRVECQSRRKDLYVLKDFLISSKSVAAADFPDSFASAGKVADLRAIHFRKFITCIKQSLTD